MQLFHQIFKVFHFIIRYVFDKMLQYFDKRNLNI